MRIDSNVLSLSVCQDTEDVFPPSSRGWMAQNTFPDNIQIQVPPEVSCYTKVPATRTSLCAEECTSIGNAMFLPKVCQFSAQAPRKGRRGSGGDRIKERAYRQVADLAERLRRKAMVDYYDGLEFDAARRTLENAIAKLREASQEKTPTAAKVYVSLGMVSIGGFKDVENGTHYFVEALKIDETVELDRDRTTPEMEDAFRVAVKRLKSRD